MELLRFIQDNFFHVAPILIAGVLAIAITSERMYALLVLFPMKEAGAFFEKVHGLVMNDRVSEAILLCERYRQKPIANVVKAGLARAHQPENLIEHGLQIAVGEAHEKIQARTSFLSTIANVATLLGLLGTILGLIQSFNAVGAASAQQRSALLAQGISTAMNATMLGLGVAIPCMIIYSFLMNRTNRMNSTIERSAVRILDLLKQRYYTLESSADPLLSHHGVSPAKAQSKEAIPVAPKASAKQGGL
jgi:biopolymer transport protein ExbB/TolQ